MRRTKMAVVLLCLQAAIAALLLLPHGISAAGECGRVQCGMGTCNESSSYAFGFACQCNPGWSRYHLGDIQFPFLPCVIPNCTIKNSCQEGSSSAPSPAPSLTNFTIFDPCLMQYCGDGSTCEKGSAFTHLCRCRDGYTNLLNDTSYPCYRQCSLGTDCKGLGLGVINGSTSSMSPPVPVSLTVKKSGAGAPVASADRPLELLALGSFLWLQVLW